MAVIAFDTLDFANKLKAAGMSENLADVQSEATAKILNDLTTNQLATKQDLHNMKMEIFAFIVKALSFAIGILGGIQAIFHFVK